jgi:hypothetical protein
MATESARNYWMRISYWAIFIVGPTVAAFFLLGDSAKHLGMCFGILLVLVLVGEHGFRLWKKLWKA